MVQAISEMESFSSETYWACSGLAVVLGFLFWNFLFRHSDSKKPPWKPPMISVQALLAFLGLRNPDIISDPDFQQRLRAAGPIVRDIGPFGMQWTFLGPDAIKFVLSTRWRDFHSGSAWPKNFQELFGDNIVFQDGLKHDRLRRLLLPAFHGASMKRYPGVMSCIINRYIDKWLSCSTDVVMFSETRRLTFEIMAALLIGCTSDASENDRLQSIFMDFGAGLFCIRIRRPWATYGRALAARDALYAHINKVIDSRQAAAAAAAAAVSLGAANTGTGSVDAPSGGSGDNSEGDKRDLLDRLMAARDGESGEGLSRHELLCQAVTLMFAGHDTTSSLLMSAMRCIAHVPAALRQELEEEQDALQALKGSAAAGAGAGAAAEVTLEELERMPRLDRFLKEVERLYPPVPQGFRVAQEDMDYGGYRIPARTIVSYDVRSANLDPAVHPRPSDFDPTRWLPKDAISSTPSCDAAAKSLEAVGAAAGAGPFGMLTFGAGPRMCLGIGFARMELKAALALLVRRCRWTLKPGQDLSARYIPTLHCGSGLVVSFEGRN